MGTSDRMLSARSQGQHLEQAVAMLTNDYNMAANAECVDHIRLVQRGKKPRKKSEKRVRTNDRNGRLHRVTGALL